MHDSCLYLPSLPPQYQSDRLYCVFQQQMVSGSDLTAQLNKACGRLTAGWPVGASDCVLSGLQTILWGYNVHQRADMQVSLHCVVWLSLCHFVTLCVGMLGQVCVLWNSLFKTEEQSLVQTITVLMFLSIQCGSGNEPETMFSLQIGD